MSQNGFRVTELVYVYGWLSYGHFYGSIGVGGTKKFAYTSQNLHSLFSSG